MKKTLTIVLLVVLVASLALTLTACQTPFGTYTLKKVIVYDDNGNVVQRLRINTRQVLRYEDRELKRVWKNTLKIKLDIDGTYTIVASGMEKNYLEGKLVHSSKYTEDKFYANGYMESATWSRVDDVITLSRAINFSFRVVENRENVETFMFLATELICKGGKLIAKQGNCEYIFS